MPSYKPQYLVLKPPHELSNYIDYMEFNWLTSSRGLKYVKMFVPFGISNYVDSMVPSNSCYIVGESGDYLMMDSNGGLSILNDDTLLNLYGVIT
tara:strand:+ start:687 stop:968 length:282 start_codon:yes stop_codon:yes gene_type:complete